jgi:hypothetical protein
LADRPQERHAIPAITVVQSRDRHYANIIDERANKKSRPGKVPNIPTGIEVT